MNCRQRILSPPVQQKGERELCWTHTTEPLLQLERNESKGKKKNFWNGITV